MSSISGTFNTRISHLMAERFSLEELANACFELGIVYQEIPGETLSENIRGLITYMDRRGRLSDLLSYLQQIRPDQPWPLPAEDDTEIPPFKGLHFFTEKDEAIFFGRDDLTKELVSHLNNHRILAVVGASGSGKSSVVRAGLIPAIRRGEVAYAGQRSDSWPIHIITPGDEPLKTLAATLTRDVESVTATKTLLDDMWANKESLDLWLHRQAATKETRLLLLIDQFEELFTQCENAEERRFFVENLVEAVQSGKQGRLSLVITLRADFYSYALEYPKLVPLLENQQRIVEAMKREELRQTIEEPLLHTNWQFQPGLVEMILQDVGAGENQQPEPGALPLLSHALLETWRRRESNTLTLAGYQDAGGVHRAIATTADTVYAELTNTEQQIARNIFLRLTELGEGTEDTRRRVLLTELMPNRGTMTKVKGVLTLLADKRLVTTQDDSIEVAHEALIRGWPTLRRWLAENRETLRLQRQLTATAQTWADSEYDPSYLYRGTQLTQVIELAAIPNIQLNSLERDFIQVSRTERDIEIAEQKALQEREIELEELRAKEAAARQEVEMIYTEKQRRTVRQLRIGGVILVFFFFGIVLAMTIAINTLCIAG